MVKLTIEDMISIELDDSICDRLRKYEKDFWRGKKQNVLDSYTTLINTIFDKYLSDSGLSEAERELLIAAAAHEGTFRNPSADGLSGGFLIAGGKDFSYVEEKDLAVRAKYLEAFEKLKERGYIFHEGGSSYSLTGSGFEKARELTAQVGDSEKKQKVIAGLKHALAHFQVVSSSFDALAVLLVSPDETNLLKAIRAPFDVLVRQTEEALRLWEEGN